MLSYLVIFGALANLAGSFAYLRDTLIGKNKPNRVTFLLWAITPFIAGAAAWSTGVRWPVVPVLMTGLVTLMIFLASFINANAYWELRTFDYVCGFLALIGLGLWVTTKNPTLAIIFAVLSDLFASTPTFVKAWKHPETETTIAYAASFFSGLTALIAIQSWTFSAYAFPMNMLLVNGVILVAIGRKKV